MRADIHHGPEQKLHKQAGYISARPTSSSSKASCDARPVHTFGSQATRCSGCIARSGESACCPGERVRLTADSALARRSPSTIRLDALHVANGLAAQLAFFAVVQFTNLREGYVAGGPLMGWHLFGLLLSKAQFALWTLRNPGNSFKEFYAESVVNALTGKEQHPSLGPNLAVRDKHSRY
jgi:hypothetical protein